MDGWRGVGRSIWSRTGSRVRSSVTSSVTPYGYSGGREDCRLYMRAGIVRPACLNHPLHSMLSVACFRSIEYRWWLSIVQGRQGMTDSTGRTGCKMFRAGLRPVARCCYCSSGKGINRYEGAPYMRRWNPTTVSGTEVSLG